MGGSNSPFWVSLGGQTPHFGFFWGQTPPFGIFEIKLPNFGVFFGVKLPNFGDFFWGDPPFLELLGVFCVKLPIFLVFWGDIPFLGLKCDISGPKCQIVGLKFDFDSAL